MSLPLHAISVRSAFLWTRLLNVPFWAILTLLPFILYKELHANPWEMTLFFAIKPVSSCLSFYWSSSLNHHPERLRNNLIVANGLKYLPFLFVPWIEAPLWHIAAYGIYMSFMRGSVTGWVELFKSNIKGQQREKIYAKGLIIDYLGVAWLPPLIGWFLDTYPKGWRWLLFATALIGITSTLKLYRLPIIPSLSTLEKKSWMPNLWLPLRDCYQLVKQEVDFGYFLGGFMVGGTGIILLQPALPSFFVDSLSLSYAEMGTVLTMCKGIGFAIFMPLWIKAFHELDIFTCSSAIFLSALFFPLCLLAASWHIGYLYAAYLLYGLMQAGSELTWHMSAPLFAGSSDSSPFTNTMILTVGLRGLIVPALGVFLFASSGITATLLCSFACCLLATYAMWRYSLQRKYAALTSAREG